MSYADTQKECEKQRDRFVSRYRKDYPKATETLLKDWDRMVSFYDFPKEHWVHLRTTNIVESPFDMIPAANQCSTSIQTRRQCFRNDLETSTYW
jgi:putative transposase